MSISGSYGMNSQRGNAMIQQPITINARYDLDEIDNRQRIAAAANAGSKDYLIHKSLISERRGVTEIQPNELVFCTHNRSRSTASNGVGAASVPVLSTLNGCYKRSSVKEQTRFMQRPNDLLSKNIEFVGIALTSANARAMKGNRPIGTTTVQIAGLNSIKNTGDKKILAGDLICWEIPSEYEVKNRPKRLGLDPEKVVLKTVPFKMMHKGLMSHLSHVMTTHEHFSGTAPMEIVNFVQGLRKFITVVMLITKKEYTGVANITDEIIKENSEEYLDSAVNTYTEFGTHLKYLLQPFIELQEEFDRRIIGRATSSCSVGEDFDIYLNK